MLFKRRPTSEPRPEPPPEAARWREASEAREREQERAEAERLRAADEAFNEHVRRVGCHFPGDYGAADAPRLSAGRRAWRHRLGGVLDALMGRDHA